MYSEWAQLLYSKDFRGRVSFLFSVPATTCFLHIDPQRSASLSRPVCQSMSTCAFFSRARTGSAPKLGGARARRVRCGAAGRVRESPQRWESRAHAARVCRASVGHKHALSHTHSLTHRTDTVIDSISRACVDSRQTDTSKIPCVPFHFDFQFTTARLDSTTRFVPQNTMQTKDGLLTEPVGIDGRRARIAFDLSHRRVPSMHLDRLLAVRPGFLILCGLRVDEEAPACHCG